jgi:hypothetical protein
MSAQDRIEAMAREFSDAADARLKAKPTFLSLMKRPDPMVHKHNAEKEMRDLLERTRLMLRRERPDG